MNGNIRIQTGTWHNEYITLTYWNMTRTNIALRDQWNMQELGIWYA